MKRLLFLAALLASGAALAQQVSIGTSPQGTAGYSMGAALAKLMAERTQYQARVQPFSGNSIALAGINRGELDFTVANEVEIVEALKGAGAYEGRKQENVRLASVLYPFTVAILVKKDSPMQVIADLKGKRLTWGYTAQVTLKTVVGAMLANGGLGEADIQPVLVPNVVRGADDFTGGKADAFFFALGAAKVTEADAAVGGVRALALSDAPEAVARMKKVLPEGYVLEVKPRPGLAGVAAPTKVLAYDYVLVAGTHVKDEVVFRLLEAMAGNKALLAASFAGFNAFDPQRMSKRVETEYHSGAQKYLIKAGQWPPQ
jgi:TRAP transporter TAXI family solute receptor